MKVLLYGILRAIAGRKELLSEAGSIQQLLEELSGLFGTRMRQYLYDQDNVKSLTVVINGRVISKSERERVSLCGEDVVELLSPIGGG